MVITFYSRSLIRTSVERKTIFSMLYKIYQKYWQLLCQYNNVTLINKVFIHVAVIAFLFLPMVRFSKSKTVARVIRSRYSEKTVKRIQKLEKPDYCLHKLELDLQFLFKCDDSNVIPNFLNFCFENGYPKYSSTFRLCQNFSALQTPTYNLAKFLVSIWNSLTKNKYTVKDLFSIC